MPTFDFQCDSCGHVWEFNRPFGSTETPLCPECGNKEVTKLIAPPAIQFKGQGFYKTDSAHSSKPASTAKPAQEKTTGDEKKAEKKEEKPAKKEEK